MRFRNAGWRASTRAAAVWRVPPRLGKHRQPRRGRQRPVPYEAAVWPTPANLAPRRLPLSRRRAPRPPRGGGLAMRAQRTASRNRSRAVCTRIHRSRIPRRHPLRAGGQSGGSARSLSRRRLRTRPRNPRIDHQSTMIEAAPTTSGRRFGPRQPPGPGSRCPPAGRPARELGVCRPFIILASTAVRRHSPHLARPNEGGSETHRACADVRMRSRSSSRLPRRARPDGIPGTASQGASAATAEAHSRSARPGRAQGSPEATAGCRVARSPIPRAGPDRTRRARPHQAQSHARARLSPSDPGWLIVAAAASAARPSACLPPPSRILIGDEAVTHRLTAT